MKDPKRQKAGKTAKQRGKAFELRCARLLPQLLDHGYWKRTQKGDKQHRGDLAPCDAKGKECADMIDDYYIECRFRTAYTLKDIHKWMAEIKRKGHYAVETWLLFGQPRGPVFALWCDQTMADEDEDWMLRCYMLGKTTEGDSE